MVESETTVGRLPRPALFWIGVGVCLAGIGKFLVEFIASAHRHYTMAGLPMTSGRWVALTAVIVGVALAAVALLSKASVPMGRRCTAVAETGHRGSSVRTRLIVVMSFALFVDQLKPASLAFIVPGMRTEYHLSTTHVALLPMVALGGNVVGSLLWGHLADRVGRRAAVLLAAVLFIGTSINAAMPTFTDHLLVSAVMGLSAGGMLPTVYALTAEVVPRRSSGVLVLQAGLIAVAAYLGAAGLATVLVPLTGWRILWFAQLPFPMALIAAHRWIPESPGFLATRGRQVEAAGLARRLGVEVRVPPHRMGGRSASLLLHGAWRTQTLIISGYALAWGTVYWGFLTFLPTVLGQSKLGVSASRLLFVASLLSLPGTALAAWLYSRWSSRGTMALYASMTSAALLALAVVPIDGSPVALAAILVALLTGASAVVAVIGPYAAQAYPAACRGLGSGLAAGSGKSGGLFGPPVIAWLLTTVPIGVVSAVVAVPLALAAVAVTVWGQEVTRSTSFAADLEILESVPAVTTRAA
ncbi:MAG: MFS transporter [Micromonosporaceae bacterium]|nr:MFS transporter [Micromonosporaceae bacterium]